MVCVPLTVQSVVVVLPDGNGNDMLDVNLTVAFVVDMLLVPDGPRIAESSVSFVPAVIAPLLPAVAPANTVECVGDVVVPELYDPPKKLF